MICGCESCTSESMIQCELNAWISMHIAQLRSDYERSHSRTSIQEGKKYENINEVYINGSHQYEIACHAEKYIYCRDINSSPDSIPNWNIVFIYV